MPSSNDLPLRKAQSTHQGAHRGAYWQRLVHSQITSKFLKTFSIIHAMRAGIGAFLITSLLSACAPTVVKEPQQLFAEGIRTETTEEMKRSSELIFNILAGTILAADQQRQESLSYYLKAAQLSDNKGVLEDALLLAISINDHKTAIPIAEKLQEMSPSAPEQFRQNLALLYIQASEYEKAIDVLDAIIADDSDLFGYDAFIAIGAVLASHIDKGTMKFLDDLVAKYPNRPTAHLARAVLAMQLKDFDAALESASIAETRGADPSKSGVLRAEALIAKGEIERGIELVAEQLERYPDDVRLRYYYATRLLEHEKEEQAFEQYERLNELMPNKPNIMEKLGYLHLRLDRVGLAEKYFHALEQWPEYKMRALYYSGLAAERRNAFGDALTYYQRIEPSDAQLFVDALIARARIYHDKGEHDHAIQMVANERNRIEDPQVRVQTYLLEGQLLEGLNYYGDAYRIYTKGLEQISLNYSPLLFARAMASYKMKNLSDAEADLQRILLKQPDHADTLNALGYMLADANIRLAEAEAYITRAYKLKPDAVEIIDSMGWIAFRLNKLQKAEYYLRLALERQEIPEIIGHLVEVLRKKCETEEANTILKKGLNKFPTDEYLLTLNRPFTCPQTGATP